MRATKKGLPRGIPRWSKSLERKPAREAKTLVLETTTARPRNEWPGDDLTIQDEEAEELAETLRAEKDRFYPEGSQWEPASLVKPSTPGRDGVPTIDDNLDLDVHAAPRSYPSWTSENSRVVSGPLGEGDRTGYLMTHPNLRFKTRAESRAYWKEKAGFVYEELMARGRWCLRVPKAVTK